MTAVNTTTDAASQDRSALPRLLPGKRHELDAADAAFFAGAKPGDPDLTFGEVLDVINPLQHIPLVGTLYRKLTGDTISPAARIVGGAIYGGPIGAGVAMAGAVIEQATGSAPDTLALNALGLGDGTAGGTAVAAARTAGPGGLIAEATTAAPRMSGADAATAEAVAPASPAKVADAKLADAKPAEAKVAAAGMTPQLSPAAFDTLIRAVGGQGANGTGGVTTASAVPPASAAAVSGETAAAGATDGRRYFPAHRNGAKPTRAVPMDLRPEDKANYDNALRLMRQNLERYSGGAPAVAPAAMAAP